MNEEKIREAIKGLGAQKYKKLTPYGDYEVYEPVYDETVCVGYPLVVLVKGEEIRYSTDEESLEILEMNYPNEEDVEGMEFCQNVSYDELK